MFPADHAGIVGYSCGKDHYHRRSNVESVFSAVKRLFGDYIRSRTDTAMKNEALAKLLAYNITSVIHSQCELGIDPVFWPKAGKDENPEILPMLAYSK